MRLQNIQFLENFNVYTSLAGIFNIFIGLLIIFMDVINEDWRHIQVGIYIFATGYAFVKVSQKIGYVVLDEKKFLAEKILQKEREKERQDMLTEKERERQDY